MKVFESYSQQVPRKLGKKCKIFNNIQVFEENEIDEEYHWVHPRAED